ncbi:MAG: hypothetical protein P8Z35_25425 [Ignavibacteriaceae bacterium]
MTPRKFLIILLLICGSQINFAQLSLRLNLEGGYYRSTSQNSAESGQKDATARLDGEIGYKYKNENNILSLKLRARPEIYGLSNNLKILKLRAVGNYYSGDDNLNWGINVIGQKNIYNGRNVNLNFRDFIFMLETLPKIDMNFSLRSNLGYGYQRVSDYVNQKMNLVFLDAELVHLMLHNPLLMNTGLDWLQES